MDYSGKYWNIKDILPYQRRFNFINAVRDIGKTYTTQGYFLERALNNKEEFFYVVRQVQEVNDGAFENAFQKVIYKEFPDIDIFFDKTTCYLGTKKDKIRILGHCRALSSVVKVKKESFPRVKWLMMDEYMLEPKHARLYVHGWDEPDELLSIYHTIDREENRVICFLHGNNTAFYNPYHLHPAFDIPYIDDGKIWYSKNVLFQRAVMSEELKKEKENNPFLDMIKGTKYGEYAAQGVYQGDNTDFIEEMPNGCLHIFTFRIESEYYGVWHDTTTRKVYISEKHNADSGHVYCLTDQDMKENERLAKRNGVFWRWLAKKLMASLVWYENIRIKLRCMPEIRRFIA